MLSPEQKKPDILQIIDDVLLPYGPEVTEEQVDQILNGETSGNLWMSDGTHNDDPALLGGYGR